VHATAVRHGSASAGLSFSLLLSVILLFLSYSIGLFFLFCTWRAVAQDRVGKLEFALLKFGRNCNTLGLPGMWALHNPCGG
jgi:hypothetical protein